jgi:hypothetical protein
MKQQQQQQNETTVLLKQHLYDPYTVEYISFMRWGASEQEGIITTEILQRAFGHYLLAKNYKAAYYIIKSQLVTKYDLRSVVRLFEEGHIKCSQTDRTRCLTLLQGMILTIS